jgi:hypothetical protein
LPCASPARKVAAAWKDYRVVGRGRGTSATDFAVWAAAGPLGGALGPARALDRGLERDPLPALATSASGWAALAWTHEGHVRLALRAPGGAFGAPVAIPSTMAVGQVGVGIDDAGTATVAWSDFVFGADSPVLATTVAAGGAPAPVQTLGDGTLTSAVALAVGARGRRRGGLGRARLDGAGGAAPIRRRLRDADHVRRSAGHGPRERRRHRFRRARHPRAAAPRGAAPRRGRRARAGDAGRRLERTLAASGQPFAVVAEEVEQPIARSVRSAFDTTETANDAALTGGGETLTVWSGSSRG